MAALQASWTESIQLLIISTVLPENQSQRQNLSGASHCRHHTLTTRSSSPTRRVGQFPRSAVVVLSPLLPRSGMASRIIHLLLFESSFSYASSRLCAVHPTPFGWGGKRAVRRAPSRRRRHALGGSGVCTHRPIRRRPTIIGKWTYACQVTHKLAADLASRPARECPRSWSTLQRQVYVVPKRAVCLRAERTTGPRLTRNSPPQTRYTARRPITGSKA